MGTRSLTGPSLPHRETTEVYCAGYDPGEFGDAGLAPDVDDSVPGPVPRGMRRVRRTTMSCMRSSLSAPWDSKCKDTGSAPRATTRRQKLLRQ
mgnify:CR=1 FL=1